MNSCGTCDQALCVAGPKNKLDVGVELYKCVKCVQNVKICSLCVSAGVSRTASHINNSHFDPGNNLIAFIDHFMYKHIFPAIKCKIVPLSSCLILYDINSEELGMQTHCNNFLSVVICLPQLCYLIPPTQYRLVPSSYGSRKPGGIIDFGDFFFNRYDNMMNVIRYLQNQSYACLYCRKEYDSLPSIDIVYGHVSNCWTTQCGTTQCGTT